MKQLFIILIFSSFLFSVSAQENLISKYSSSISSQELKEHVKILSSDEFMGRETGQEGENMAGEYILNKFIELNLAGPGSEKPFIQEFELHKNAWDNFYLISGTDSLKIDKDMYVTGMWPEGNKELQIVFAGYGADTKLYSDYKNLNVDNKIVAFINGEPMDKNGKFLSNNSYIPEYSILGFDKAKIAFAKGAKGAIMIEPEEEKINNLIRINKQFNKNQQFFLPGTGVMANNKNGLITLSEKSASILFSNNIDDWAKYQKKLDKGKTVNLNTRVKLVSAKGSNKVVGENVLGMIKGSEKPEEVVIITAHYDHLGKRDDIIFNGADDNATGTAAVIEIAEAFCQAAEEGHRPKRSIIFMPVSGEEKGLLGSKYYTSNPLVPLNSTKAAINMDMIGRQDDSKDRDTSYVYIYLSDEEGSKLDLIAKNSSRIVGGETLPVYKYPSNSGYSTRGSDHVSFEDQGIPVMYFHCGTHEDYHRPSDTWEKIDYPNMTRISRIVFSSAWEIANQE